LGSVAIKLIWITICPSVAGGIGSPDMITNEAQFCAALRQHYHPPELRARNYELR
jgi:hypothetical protein